MSEKMTVRLPIVQASTDLAMLEPLSLPDQPFVQDDVPHIDFKSLGIDKRTELRTSSYTIYVDLPGNEDEMLLVHGYSGAYDRASKRVVTYLRSLESRHAPKPLYGDWSPASVPEGEVVKPSDETIEILKQRGYLVALTPKEEETLFVKLATRSHFSAIRRAPGFVLMPTYQCNLRCPYCFQDHMRTDPAYSHLLRMADRVMADRMLAGMDQIEAAHGIDKDSPINRQVTLFGGEPLLAESRPTVEYLIEQIQSRRTTNFFAISNATELDAYRDLLGEHAISGLQITLDGPPEEHDQRRIYPDGSGSFERIASNIEMALELGVQISVRMNIDRLNVGQLPTLAAEFKQRGWNQHEGFRAYVAPITAGNGHVDTKTTFSSWQLGREIEKLKREHAEMSAIGVSDDMLQQQARRIFDEAGQNRAPIFRTAFCGAHATMYVIDSFGDIYACWERTGDPEVRIGHITESGQVLMQRSMLNRWRARNAVSNPVCRKCRYATSCGGGCAVLAEEASGDTYKNHCDGYAKRFRASVAEAYMAHQRGDKQGASVDRLCDV